MRIKKQQNNNIDTKPLNIFDYFNKFKEKAKDLMDEIEDADNDINFNIFTTPLNFLLDISNDKITLKKAEINQRDLDKKIEALSNYKPKNGKEKEEINKVLMHANEMLEYEDKIIEAFRNGTFLSEHLKKLDAAAYDYVLKDVNSFIQKIEFFAEKINSSLFEAFFESSSPADYAKMLINTKNLNENKEIAVEIEDRI